VESAEADVWAVDGHGEGGGLGLVGGQVEDRLFADRARTCEGDANLGVELGV
jgi:hypothetical protein